MLTVQSSEVKSTAHVQTRSLRDVTELKDFSVQFWVASFFSPLENSLYAA